MKKSLRERTQELNNNLPFIVGRTKGELEAIKGEDLTITDFGFMEDGDKEYVAFTIKEDPNCFYFGGQVLTNDLKEVEEDGYGDEIRKEGLPVRFGSRKTKDGKKEYTTVEYYPLPEDKPADNGKGKKK
jgi:hypothetical protein